MKPPKIWIELLFRTEAWRGIHDVRESDYKVMGGPLPGAEFPTVSSAFTMFSKTPSGLSAYFERPMQSLDILQLVTLWPVSNAVKTLPLLIVSREDVFRLGLNTPEMSWQEVTGSPDHVAACLPGYVVSSVAPTTTSIKLWKSRLKTKAG